MIGPDAISAANGFITQVGPPAIFAAATIFGGVLVTAMFQKKTHGRTGGVRGLIIAGWERLHVANTRRWEETPAAADPDAMSSRWVEYSPPPEPEAELASEPETQERTATASTCAIDWPSNSAALRAAEGAQTLGRYCKMDIASTLEGLEFTIEVPGIKESDLDIRLVGDTIEVSGQLERDRTDKTFRIVEREYGAFCRFIKVAEGVPLHRIQASLDRGLLTVFVPNPTVQIGKTIAINSAARRVFDGGDEFELKIDLPGVDASDVDLAVREGILTITCRNGPQAARTGDQTETTSAQRLLQSLEVPAGVDANQIRAVLAKGVLTVILPIAAGHRQRTIPLQTIEEADRLGMLTRRNETEPHPPAAGLRQSEAAIGAQTASDDDSCVVSEDDSCVVSETVSRNCGPLGEGADCPF